MSRKANCSDNASIESFWATLKAECFGSFLPPSRATAHAMIFDYIETFDNPCLSGLLPKCAEWRQDSQDSLRRNPVIL